jgi:uncharacterized protein
VVSSSVNAVGVEINTASKELLKHVSGLSERLAGNVIRYRNENGAFLSREDLMNVHGMGPRTFEQAAGFLRIRGAKNPLDASAVHPESYGVVESMSYDLKCTVADLMSNANLRSKIKLQDYVSDKVGVPTLTDILEELAKPGRDPREQFELFSFAEGVNDISDLEIGMQLPGIVTNVTAFGAFVDIGVHQDGLVHLSEMADRFIKNPHDVLKVNQRVRITVINVDEKRKRVSLSMRTNPFEPGRKSSDGTSSGETKQGGKYIEPLRREKKEEPSNPFANALKDLKIPRH